MEQLGIFDAACLYFDKRHAPINTTTIWIYDSSKAKGGKPTFKDVFDHVASCIQSLPLLRKRVIRVPGEIDLPWWVDDTQFSLEYHVRHVSLPKPGDWQQFRAQAAFIHARPLDLNRPLWELYMIDGLNKVEGLPPKAFALVFKAHHAAVDGKAIMAITEILHSAHPTRKKADASPGLSVNKQLLKGALFARGMYNGALQPMRAMRALSRLTPASARLLRSGRSPGPKQPGVPRTRFGGVIDSSRVLDTRFYQLETIKKMCNIVPDATVNDVALAIFGGALRQYLNEHSELPETPMRAVTPVALRPSADADSIGNRISLMAVNLATDLEDPRARLEAICANTRRKKESASTSATPAPFDFAGFLPTGLMAPGIRLGATLLGHGLNIGVNTIVSNVAGPRKPLYLKGCKLVSLTGAGPVVDGLGLINYVTSYLGKIGFGFTACQKMMPDPDYYSACIDNSFDAMLSLITTKRRVRRKSG